MRGFLAKCKEKSDMFKLSDILPVKEILKSKTPEK